jgi:hypothetical protein
MGLPRGFAVFLPALLLGALALPAGAQVLVAPPVVAISPREPFGSFIVLNQSDQVQEVTVDFRFGYPVSDSLGTLSMVYGDTLPAAARSLRAQARAFPRQFALSPGQQQTVRLTGRPPEPATDGTYWVRIVTASTPQRPPPDPSATGVQAQVIFRLEQVTTLLYRHGRASTAVEIGAVRLVDDSASLGVLVPLELGGNSPFLGRIHAAIRDEAGRTVAEDFEFFAMYVDVVKRFVFPRDRFPAGAYTLELTLTAERDDVPPAALLSIEPVRRSLSFRLP